MSLDAAKESLKSKSVAFIGTGDPPIAHAKQIDIIGNQNFDHFDLIILDVAGIHHEITERIGNKNWRWEIINPSNFYIFNIIKIRLQNIYDLCQAGSDVIVYIDRAMPKVKLHGAESIDVGKFPILKLVDAAYISGSATEYIGPPIDEVRNFFISVETPYKVSIPPFPR